MERRLELLPDPLATLRTWYEEAVEVGTPFADAVALATASLAGRPSARMVLHKGFDDRGVRFYTNYESRKGQELDDNPHAALVFFWAPLHCQVRVEGAVERLSAEESDAYFATRARESQIGAWASPQSQPIAAREALDHRFAELGERYAGRDVPRPPHWGGYRVVAERVEFWIGQDHRMHDRFLYTRHGDGWQRERLAP